MYCHIYIFRHSETCDNKNRIFSGCRDSCLTKLGIKQAKIIARKLRNKKIGLAYQTHLCRSTQTLKEVLKYHKGVKIITDDRMIERCYGDLEGTSKTKFELVDPTNYKIFHRSYETAPPNGESIKMVERRVLSFILDLLRKIRKERVNVAISAHGNSMRPFRRYFERFSVVRMMELENPQDDYLEYKIKV